MKQARVLLLVVMMAALLPACAHNTRILSSPQQTTPLAALPLDEPERDLVIDDVQVIQNGQAGNVDPGFIQRFVLEMQRSGLFRTVYDPLSVRNAPKDAVRMKLYVSEMLDRQWGEKVGKDISVGMSYLALMPVMPYQMEYSVSFRALTAIPGQAPQEFESFTKAEVAYKGFSDMRAAEDDLKRTAVNDCLNGFLAKIRSNEEFLSALKLE